MITETEREELKKVIGNRYSQRVLAMLNSENIISSSGKKYSIEYIRQVFNGHHSNPFVENAIYELRNKILQVESKLKENKSKDDQTNE